MKIYFTCLTEKEYTLILYVMHNFLGVFMQDYCANVSVQNNVICQFIYAELFGM